MMKSLVTLKRHRWKTFATFLVLLLLVSCVQAVPPTAPTSAPTEAVVSEAPAESGSSQSNVEPFDASTFGANSAEITNPWLPMQPGTRYVYEGTTVEDDGTVVPHRVEINITDLTKVISGIRTIVTWDLDYSDGELVEAELAFFAQDKAGTVWRMGEYPEEYDGTQMIANPSWIHGLQEAQAGIMMQANPQVGTPSYAEGWGPAVGWTDRGQVDQMGQKVCVPVDCYEDVLVIAESSQSEINAQQLKSYATNVGNIHVGWRGEGEKTQEVLELTRYEQVSEEALAEMRANALKLEVSALANSPDVYAQTTPIELPAGVEAPVLTATENNTASESQASEPLANAAEIVVYAAELPESAMSEMGFTDDPASPGGKLIDLPNFGDELDPPPENDPHTTFPIQVMEGPAYRCWIHMKVGEPKGVSTANVVFVQISDAEDAEGNEILIDNSGSYLTAEGPQTVGWVWVPCDFQDAPGEGSLIHFGTTGEVMVRIQAGMEGVGFDQFVLSSEKYLDKPPSEAIVQK